MDFAGDMVQPLKGTNQGAALGSHHPVHSAWVMLSGQNNWNQLRGSQEVGLFSYDFPA